VLEFPRGTAAAAGVGAPPAEAPFAPRIGGMKEPRTPRLDIPKVLPVGLGATAVLGKL